MRTTWLTSDLHIGHARISELADRPFSSVDEMDETLIERWNSVVNNGDIVIVVGDLVMGKFDESIKKAGQLKGIKFLVPGNHDRVSPLYKGSEAKKTEWAEAYADAGFTVTRERIEHYFGKTLALICHFPYEGDSHDVDRYADQRPQDHGQILIHGHTHSKEKVRGRQIHVGVDSWDFTPVHEEQIMELIDTS